MAFAANIDLSSLDGSTGFSLSGALPFSLAGISVASAGDVNGDGFDDVLVGSNLAGLVPVLLPDLTVLVFPFSASYLVFGKAAGFASNLDLSSLNGANGVRIVAQQAGATIGRPATSAGDVNGDGFDDVIVGSPTLGGSWVVFGKASGFTANLNPLTVNGTNGFKLTGGTGLQYDNSWIGSAGDVNGDGFDDVIVGVYQDNANGVTAAGAAYVIYGKASGFAANLNLSSVDGSNGFKLSGVAAVDFTGISVGSAGDVNGDGFADMIVGAFGVDAGGSASGGAYVVFGKDTGFAANTNLSILDGSNGFRLGGAAGGDYAGRSVASAGDINGDGFDDVIVGAGGADPHGIDSGASFVVFGKAAGFSANIDLARLDGSNGFKLSGAAMYDSSGVSVGSAGDVNGDGFDDLIIGAAGAGPHGSGSGAAYVLFGKATGFSANIDLSSLDGSDGFKLSGEAAHDQAGRWVSSAGDVNGDGFADIVIGAAFADAHGTDSGKSYVVFGRKPDHAVVRTGTDASNVIYGGDFADTLSGLGGDDVLRGLGRSDVLDGGAGDDVLDGGRGGDIMVGGVGDDLYLVDSAADVVTELAGEGTDTVQSNMTFSLAGTHLENLLLLGKASNGTGNDSDNRITGTGIANVLIGAGGDDTLLGGRGADTLDGGTGNDTLDGGADADAMAGGAGNDTYYVDNALDLITEAADQGSDTVMSAINYDLRDSPNLENLSLLGRATIGIGNELDNTLTGNDRANTLTGGAGNDRLIGGGGRDAMSGGFGADAFVLNAPSDGPDTITDFVPGLDWLELSGADFGGGLVAGFEPTLVVASSVGAALYGGNDGVFIFDDVGGRAGTLYWDADGHSPTNAVAIAVLNGVTGLAAADLHIV